MPNEKPNQLIHSTSPYLLQHAYNPVSWYPWSADAIEKAKAEDKPILVSIGYSACHWCHVMEHESFERQATAELMNEHFVCIKIDREERPDLDNIYMDAVQHMGISGGWPLNVFLLPDLKPFYGGTYFQPQQWAQLLTQIAFAYKEHKPKLTESAEQFATALRKPEVLKYNLSPEHNNEVNEEVIDGLYRNLSMRFDKIWGGLDRSPKFMMPSIWQWVLGYSQTRDQPDAAEHLHLTLNRIGRGGIYDQIGGGFSRYSVDAEWFAPHFEKMLYDNAQLLGLYANAYQHRPSELYASIIDQTISWLSREMLHPEGGFYAALDADTEGEEGKYYTFSWVEFATLLGQDAELAAAYYSLEPHGNWEGGVSILFPKTSDAQFADRYGITTDQLKDKVKRWQSTLLATREQRTRPGLDDKIITGWNALMISGLCRVYAIFGNKEALNLAFDAIKFLERHLMPNAISPTSLMHTWKLGQATVPAFLDDYTFLAQAYLDLHKVTFKSEYLDRSVAVLETILDKFGCADDPFFFFAQAGDDGLIARKKEIFDNVIPSSNSALAHLLYDLGTRFDHKGWLQRSDQMLRSMYKPMNTDTQFTANWANLLLKVYFPSTEVVVMGPDFERIGTELLPHLAPNIQLIATDKEDGTSLTAHCLPTGCQTLIYVCHNHTCKLPVKTVAEAVAQLKPSSYN
jgi:uncharacterized protein YyaL (SSP411 family)